MNFIPAYLKDRYIVTRFDSSDDTWPPDQPQHFTPVVLVHQETQVKTNVEEERKVRVKALRIGGIREVSKTTNKTTRNLQETFSKLDQIDEKTGHKKLLGILVEGAPGVGKSVLLKHIAYLWAQDKLITSCSMLFLLYLRDPAVQEKIKSIRSLICHVYRNDEEGPEISACEQHLKQDKGRSLTILLDGYDEFPQDLRKDSFIANLLKRKVLPYCTVVVSSRPHALTDLRERFFCRVEILGFSVEDQLHFVEHSLDDVKKQQELKKFLRDHPTISSLCYIPFNMTVLLLLFKNFKTLPTSSTELYSWFICLTIHRYLTKCDDTPDEEIDSLDKLPVPYSEIIKQLSKLAFKYLGESKLVFSLDEIKEECPDLDIKEYVNGCGLLQAVEYLGGKMQTKKTASFNFIHFSVQEFLAAYHVCKLSQDKERSVLDEHFWNDIFLNMFAFYVASTKGQRPSFKAFLSRDGPQAIHESFLYNTLRCLRLYHCFCEAGDAKRCRAIEKSAKLNKKVIDFRDTQLSPNDMECLTLFLSTSSCKHWERLDLNRCFIQDQGVHIMHRGLMNSDVTISELWLHDNALTALSAAAISDLVIKCKVKVLGLNDNATIGEDKKLYCMWSDANSVLEELHMERIKTQLPASVAESLRKRVKITFL